MDLHSHLEVFQEDNGIVGKGPLSVMLILTRNAKMKQPPFKREDFLTARGGQVKGLGGPAVQAILEDYGIRRVLAEEGGRTSRGSIERMQQYVLFLNMLYKQKMLDFKFIERWWVERVQDFFSSQPLRLKADISKSLRHLLAELIKMAHERQSECPGTMVVGAVIQHLVGAKLALALPEIEIEHEGFSVADQPGKRKGDFLINDAAIHVTTAPTESLIRKCRLNLDENIRPIIITTELGAGGARALATNFGIADRLDILEVEQFVATNIYEWCGFSQQQRPVSLEDLLVEYNRIIDSCETDPSLKIVLG
jgi:hypothetical protein